jgi:hypothetical protein
MTWFMPGLGSWDFWHKMKHKYNENIQKYVCSKIFSNQHKIFEKENKLIKFTYQKLYNV